MTCLKPCSQCVSELETYKFLLLNGYWLKNISLIFCPEAKDSFCSHSEFALSSVQFSRSVVSDSLWPHGLEPTSLLCPWDFSRPRILEWVAISSSRESSQPRDQTRISCIVMQIFYHWATREAHPFIVILDCYFTTNREMAAGSINLSQETD